MNPHSVAGRRRRRRRHHPVCPTSLSIRARPILEELFAGAPSLRGPRVPSRLPRKPGRGVGVWWGGVICRRMGRCEPIKGLRGRRLPCRHLLQSAKKQQHRAQKQKRRSGLPAPRGPGPDGFPADPEKNKRRGLGKAFPRVIRAASPSGDRDELGGRGWTSVHRPGRAREKGVRRSPVKRARRRCRWGRLPSVFRN